MAISDLTVQGFQLDGINALNDARNVRLAGVTCRGNGRYGLAVGGASQVEIDSCLLENNGTAGLFTGPYSRNAPFSAAACRAAAAPGWVDSGGRVWLGPSSRAGRTRNSQTERRTPPPEDKPQAHAAEGAEQ